MRDRTEAPALQPIQDLQITEPEVITLDNGIPVYRIHTDEQKVARMEIIFQAGRWVEPQKLVAALTARMLKEGTHNRSSSEIANIIDFYGADLKANAGHDRSSLVLTTLTKHFGEMTQLIRELLIESNFPERELNNITHNMQQKLQLNLQKNEYLTQKKFQSALYGDNHPYGYMIQTGDFDNIEREQLVSFYEKCYTADNCFIIVAGNVGDELIKQLNNELGDWRQYKSFESVAKTISPHKKNQQHLEGPQHLQSAISMGLPLFNKTHPDYHKLTVLNTILGGYFGSRLMGNLREQNGYTYGIHSSLISYEHGGHLKIATEVGADVKTDAIKEIYKEIERLQQEPVPEQELKMVKNYLQGMMLNKLDGPFRLAQTIKSLYIYNLNINYLYSLIHTIKTIESEELQYLANRYLIEDQLYEIVVG